MELTPTSPHPSHTQHRKKETKPTQLIPQNNTPPIKAPKVKIKNIHYALAPGLPIQITLIHHNDSARLFGPRAAIGARPDALYPLWTRAHVVVAREKDVGSPIADSVQLVEVGGAQRRRRDRGVCESDLRTCVLEVRGDRGREVGVL